MTPASPGTAILVLLGPTGTGKSELAMRVALLLGGEIVGCDALQVYRGFDAATAKPEAADRAQIPHWLVDVADPTRDYSAADYVREADASIAAIVARRRVPIVVGGTGMYLRALLKGLVAAPPRDVALRSRLRRIEQRFGSARLWRLLRRVDPQSAARLAPADAQRVVRALEMAAAGGALWSERLSESGSWRDGAERYRALKFGLDLGRDELAARLTRRVDSFLASGLVAETEALLASGVPRTANAWKAIGYREVLRGLETGADPAVVRDEIVAATRRFAKRQRTWFRTEPGVTWIDASEDPSLLAERIASAWRAWTGGQTPRNPC